MLVTKFQSNRPTGPRIEDFKSVLYMAMAAFLVYVTWTV